MIEQDFLWFGIIGDTRFDENYLDKLITEHETGGTAIGIMADVSSSVGRQAITYAKQTCRKFMIITPIMIATIEMKTVYRRNHKIINTADRIIVFEEEHPSAGTTNAYRYAMKQNKQIYRMKL